MYFDFEDRHSDIEPIGSALNRRFFVALAVALHAAVIALLLYAPELLPVRLQPVEVVQQPPPRREPATFVFVEPRVELPPLREPERPELSDRDRSARSPLKAPPGLQDPDTRNALRVPPLDTPERIRGKNEPCLDAPPPFANPKAPEAPKAG